MEYGLVKKIAAWAHANGGAAQNFEVVLKIQDQKEKIENK